MGIHDAEQERTDSPTIEVVLLGSDTDIQEAIAAASHADVRPSKPSNEDKQDAAQLAQLNEIAAAPIARVDDYERRAVWLTGRRTYEAYEIIFRRHHETHATLRRGPYEHYRLVYRYGYELGTDARYAHVSWAGVEQDARPRWEERNPGTWNDFKDTIQYAWNTCRIWQND